MKSKVSLWSPGHLMCISRHLGWKLQARCDVVCCLIIDWAHHNRIWTVSVQLGDLLYIRTYFRSYSTCSDLVLFLMLVRCSERGLVTYIDMLNVYAVTLCNMRSSRVLVRRLSPYLTLVEWCVSQATCVGFVLRSCRFRVKELSVLLYEQYT